MSHPRDPQITSNNSYKHVYFKYLAYQNFFEMSRDDHPRHSYKHVHFEHLAYLTSKCLEILNQTPNYLKLVQKIWNRKYLHNCKLYTIKVVLMGPKSGQDALKHFLGHAKHSVTIWDKGKKNNRKKKEVTCASQFRLHYNMMHQIMTSLAMCLLWQIVWFRRSFSFQDFIGSIERLSGYQQFHWWVKTPYSTISPCKFLLDLSLPRKSC
jgi:hypothetical protein